MLFKAPLLELIKKKKVTLAFRRWTKPTVKAGGELKTPIGVLAIHKIEPIKLFDITEKEAKLAGVELEPLLKELKSREGKVYKISFSYKGADPRIKLREDDDLSEDEFTKIRAKLTKMGPWTIQFLKLLQKYPGVRATELAQKIGMETLKFKTDVRKLKNLGLTISLGTGYKVSPRGLKFLK